MNWILNKLEMKKESESDGNEKDFFYVKTPKHYKVFFLCLFAALVVIFLVLYSPSSLFDLNNLRFSWTKENRKTFLIFFVSIILGFLGNIFASIIWESWIKFLFKKSIDKTIERIYQIANPHLTNSILKELQSYNKKYCKNYSIFCHLKKHSTLDALVCVVEYSYFKNISNENLIFKFTRIRNSEESLALYDKRESLIDQYYDNEFYYEFDERSMKEVIPEENREYKLTYLEVNGERMNFIEKVEGNVIEYNVDIKANRFHKQEFTHLHYIVEYIIEKDSLLFFTIDLPSFDVRCEFDYGDVSDLVDVYAFDFVNSKKGPTRLHELSETKLRLHVKDTWVIPKSNFMFAWYEKKVIANDLIPMENA